MKKSVLLFSALLLTSSLPASAEKFNLDEAHSTVGFSITHLKFATVTGRFNKFSGSFDFNEKTGKLNDLMVKIQPSSIDTNQEKRDTHLKSKDFFDVETFPSLEFKGNKVSYKGTKPVSVSGDLTMHGITKPITLKIDYKGSVVDPWGMQKAIFEATAQLNRKDFGIVWNKALDSGGMMLSDEVKITITGEASADAPKK